MLGILEISSVETSMLRKFQFFFSGTLHSVYLLHSFYLLHSVYLLPVLHLFSGDLSLPDIDIDVAFFS